MSTVKPTEDDHNAREGAIEHMKPLSLLAMPVVLKKLHEAGDSALCPYLLPGPFSSDRSWAGSNAFMGIGLCSC